MVEENKEEKKEKMIEENNSGKNEKQESKKETKKIYMEACVRGKDLHISFKHAKQICRFINNKKINEAIKILEEVIKEKIAVPFQGYEIPHRKGMREGRYPKKASKAIIKLLRNLNANAVFLNMNPENLIVKAKTDCAARPMKTGGRKAKRCHVTLRALEEKKVKEKK